MSSEKSKSPQPGEQVSFTCTGVDQYGQSFAISSIEWSATGGAVADDGLYSADQNNPGGLFTVRAESGGHEAIAEVRVYTKDEKPEEPKDTPERKMLVWSGEVPPQKWMNFYTKVLSRFASSSDLKLTVGFQVLLDDEQTENKAQEARAGLKDLGLDGNISQR